MKCERQNQNQPKKIVERDAQWVGPGLKSKAHSLALALPKKAPGEGPVVVPIRRPKRGLPPCGTGGWSQGWRTSSQ